ncbi:MAG: prolyl oligopeptidase family serine peptidase [Saprospiraceae bacterium]|nr:prolyl oligopeptidase family serine peptidase [Saprospiraceae bacterium]
MRILILSFLMMMAGMTYAQKTPLLDRDLFFGNPEITGGQLSPDGKWISFMKAHKGIMNVWVKKFDEAFDKAKPLTDSQRPLYGYFWTDDSKYILYVKDKDGDENINIFAVDPMASANAETGVPESRNLTPLKEVTAQIYDVSRLNPDIMMIGLNDRDKAWHDLYQLKISTGELTLMYQNNDRITSYDFDWDEKLRVLSRTDEKGNTVFLRVDENKQLTPIYETTVTEQAYISNWNEDNSQFYLVSNVGELDKSTLFLMDPKTTKKVKIESDPENKVDFGGLRMDRHTRKIIGTSYTLDKTKYSWNDKRWEEMYKFLCSKFPGREVNFQSATKDYSKFLIATGGDKYASEAYFYDAKTKKLIHQYTPRPKLKEVEKHLAEMTPVSYKSKDGLEIPAYLTLPAGMEAKNLPVVVLVHGGPKGPRDYWGYNAEVQFLANRGYAVLQPNFRASGGYGKKFLNAGDLQWGKLMQDDITYGVQYLINKGIADKNRIAIMGGSYGGYATLAGLAFTPDLYACGVDIVGPSNIFTLLESVPAYWEAGRAFLYGMVGDPNTEEGKKLIREASPLFSADKIVKPLLIIQGANDPRVKQAEADQIVIALRDKGKKVDYLLAKDEGHGFAKPLNKKAMYAHAEKFLSEVIKGRYQEDMPTDVKETLQKLMVDVNTVKYEPKGAVTMAKELPKIENMLKAGVTEYDVTLEFNGQKMPMTTTRTVSQKEGNWVVSDKSAGPMGESVDEVVLNNDFKPVSRSISQMGQSIPMVFSDNKATIDMMGQKMEINFEGAFINDGPASDYIVAGLPLKEGYTLHFQMPDIMTMKAKKVTLTTKGTEEVNGVSYHKVEVVNNDNPQDIITFWINPSTKQADKMTQVIPAYQNAVLTMTKK